MEIGFLRLRLQPAQWYLGQRITAVTSANIRVGTGKPALLDNGRWFVFLVGFLLGNERIPARYWIPFSVFIDCQCLVGVIEELAQTYEMRVVLAPFLPPASFEPEIQRADRYPRRR